MDIEIAKKIVEIFDKKDGPKITLIEAQGMIKVMTTGNEILFALQKGDVTFLAWVHVNKKVFAKIQYWL